MVTKELAAHGFSRIERDDRLLDVFSKETPEKGVELWEKWSGDTIEIIRIHGGKQVRYGFSRQEVEQTLLEGRYLILN